MKANVYDRSIYITEPETIVARSVEEYTVQFEFSEAWDGYATVAVFKTHDGTLKEVITVDGEAVIPWEVLQEPGVLYIGIYGTKTGKFRPTVWSEPQTIYDGAEEGDPAADPETTPWQQAVEQISEDVASAQAAAEASQTAAAAGPKIVNNTWYVWDSEEEAYVTTGVSATEPGPEGYSPSVEITKSGKRTTITITDKTGPHVATILDGEDGPGSGGNGDMTKAIYDTNNDGTVDSADVATNATKLGNQLPAYYAKATDIPTVPTNVSAFTNDAGYITSAPTKTSDLTNDSGFITGTEAQTALSELMSEIDDDYVAKAGGTMSGSLGIQDNVIDVDGDHPSESQIGIALKFKDKDDVDAGLVRLTRATNGRIALQLLATRNVNGTDINNALTIGIHEDGTLQILLSALAKAAWRSALGINTVSYNVTLDAATTYIEQNNRNVSVYVIGGMAVMTFSVNLTSTQTPSSPAYYQIGTLPAECKPANTIYFCSPIRDSTDSAAVSINNSLAISLRHRNTSSGFIQFSMAYPLDPSVL